MYHLSSFIFFYAAPNFFIIVMLCWGSFHNMQSSIDDTAAKSEFIWIFSSLLFICQSFITMSHSWDELGFIVFFCSSAKKAFDEKKKFQSPIGSHWTIVSETVAGSNKLVMCRMWVRMKRKNLNFYVIKYRWATLKLRRKLSSLTLRYDDTLSSHFSIIVYHIQKTSRKIFIVKA